MNLISLREYIRNILKNEKIHPLEYSVKYRKNFTSTSILVDKMKKDML